MSLSAHLARRLVRGYPRAWRDRYQDEVLALLDDGGVGGRGCADLAANLLREWGRAFIGWRPGEQARLIAGSVGEVLAFWILGATAAVLGSYAAVIVDRLGFRLGTMPWFAFVVFMVPWVRLYMANSVVLAGPPAERTTRWGVGNIELVGWLAVVFAATGLIRSAEFELDRIGIPGSHVDSFEWRIFALQGALALQALSLCTKRQMQRVCRGRELGRAAKAALVASVPRRALDL